MQTLIKPITSLNKLDVLKSLQIANQDINQCCFKGRCSAYPGLPTVETFVKLNLRFYNDCFSHVLAKVSTGKYLNVKSTFLSVTNDKEDNLSFGFHNHKITILVNGTKEEIDCTPTDGNIQAYETVLESLYLGNYEVFISPDAAMEALRIITPALSQNIRIHEYEPNWNPS